MVAELLGERPASPYDLAILRHPDRRTDWAQLIRATLADPVDDLVAVCDERLRDVNRSAPMVGARLADEIWRQGDAPTAVEVDGDPLASPLLLDSFDLGREPPVRILVGDDGRRIALVAHHAALDGRAAVVLLHALIGGPIPEPDTEIEGSAPNPGPGSGYRGVMRRLVRPVDRVPPSPTPPTRDSLAVRTLPQGRLMVARIATAAIEAIEERCAELGWPWRRIGLSIPVGGAANGIGNVATYRRIDLTPGESTRVAINEAIKGGPMPREFARAPRSLRLLSPISDRFSDSLLVANHGTYDLPGLSQLAVFPVARGRSAVVFGSAAVAGGELTLSLRARDLTQPDAEELLDRTIERMEAKRVERT
jgi:hypothetical protein